MKFADKPLSAGLYFVSTPIGNARDITLRALDILALADVIAAEDTRTARKLMDIHGVPLGQRPLVAYHDHSGEAAIRRLLSVLAEGKSVAYVSEAGTPLLADPGFELGRAARDAGFAVTAAPGASALLTALAVSGLGSDRFAFCGFLPAAQAQRETEIAGLRDLPFTLIFYESPKRIQETLVNLRDILGGERQVAVCRELTKKFEEITSGTLDEVTTAYAERDVKGEIVLVVGRAGAVAISGDRIEDALREAMKTMRIKDAATVVSGALGLPRRQVYQIALGMGMEKE